MNVSESVLIHRGKLIKFHCQSVSSSGSLQTRLSVSVYQYCHDSHCFSRCTSDNEGTLKTVLERNWSIVLHKKVHCSITCVLQPCVLLQSDAGCSIYQFREFKSLVKVLDTKSVSISLDYQISQCFILDGPSLLCFHLDQRKLYLIKRSESEPILDASLPFKSAQKIFLLNVRNTAKLLNLTFLFYGHIETKSTSWIKIEVILYKNVAKLCIGCESSYSKIPSVYSSITTAVYPWGVCANDHSFLITTTYGQFLEISNDRVSNICDIPFNQCRTIYTVGEEKYKVAILTDETTKQCCIVNLNSFEVIKTWNSVSHVTFGMLGNSLGIQQVVGIFLTSLNKSIIDHTGCMLISDVKDVISKKTEKVPDLRLQSSGIQLDGTECDLFSSPGNHPEESPALRKVVDSLECSVEKHRRSVEQLRRTLKQHDTVLYSTNKALLEMNNNLKLIEEQRDNTTQPDKRFSDLVDLFSAEPYVGLDENSKSDQRFLRLNNTWQRTITNQWIIGFNLTNISKKWFHNFFTLFQSSNAESVSAIRQTIHTRHFKLSYLKKGRLKHICNKAIDNALTDQNPKSQKFDTVTPGEDFVVVARFPSPSFLNESPWQPQCSAAIGATMSDVVGEEPKEDSRYIFQTGKVYCSAVAMATNALSVKAERLEKSLVRHLCAGTANCFCADHWIDDFSAIIASHDNTSAFMFSSLCSDVEATCKEILHSIQFKYLNHLNLYLCNRQSNFHLMVVELDVQSKQRVVVSISSRSQFEESLFLSCVREQACGQLTVEKMDEGNSQHRDDDFEQNMDTS